MGYCQGMTDLLAPFLEVYADDQEASAGQQRLGDVRPMGMAS